MDTAPHPHLPPLCGLCAWCGVVFSLPPTAKHKRFCCSEHRSLWHAQRSRDAREALLAQEAARSGQST